jgi:hypothetical protein
MGRWHHQDQRIGAYKGKNLSDSSAHDLIIRSTDVQACTPRQIPSILKEWRNPRHEQFQARTLWSLFNSFTEVLRGNLNDLPKRTEAVARTFGFVRWAVQLQPELSASNFT